MHKLLLVLISLPTPTDRNYQLLAYNEAYSTRGMRYSEGACNPENISFRWVIACGILWNTQNEKSRTDTLYQKFNFSLIFVGSKPFNFKHAIARHPCHIILNE